MPLVLGYPEAVQEYLTVLRLNPDNIVAHYNLANAYSKQGRLKEAIQESMPVLRLNPDDIVAHYNLGEAYRRKGLKEEARKHFRMALKLNPDFSPAQKALEALDSNLKNPR